MSTNSKIKQKLPNRESNNESVDFLEVNQILMSLDYIFDTYEHIPSDTKIDCSTTAVHAGKPGPH